MKDILDSCNHRKSIVLNKKAEGFVDTFLSVSSQEARDRLRQGMIYSLMFHKEGLVNFLPTKSHSSKRMIALKFRFSFEFQISKEMTVSLIAVTASAVLEALLKLLLGL